MKPRSRKPRSALLARKAEEQERIREIHSALGGSSDAYDRASDRPPDEDVTLESRIDAYIKLQTARRGTAPVTEVAEPLSEPPPVLEEPPAPIYEPPPLVPKEPPAPIYEPPPLVLDEPPAPIYEGPTLVLDEPPAPSYEPPVVVEEPPVVEAAPAVEEPPPPVAEPPVQPVATPAPPAPRRARELRIEAPRGPSAMSRARTAAAPRARTSASGLGRAFRGSTQALVHVVVKAARVLPALARLVTRSVGLVFAALAVAIEHARAGIRRLASARRSVRARPPRPARSREERREGERLSPSVLQRVQGYTPSVAEEAPAAVVADPEPDPEKVESVAPPPPPPSPPAATPREARVARRLHVTPRLLLLAAALAGAATAAVLVVNRGESSSVDVSAKQHAAAVRAMANASTSRASFSNPGAYASAMTLLALANGRTHVKSQPSCDEKSTWKRWSCDAKGLPSVGPYAGRWVTYRCTPSYAPQAGGAPAALVVNCRPQTA